MLEYLDNNRHALDNLAFGYDFYVLHPQIFVGLNARHIQYQQQDVRLQLLQQLEKDSPVIPNEDLLRIIETQLKQAHILDSNGCYNKKKGNKKVTNAVIILTIHQGVVSSKDGKGSKIKQDDKAYYFMRRWNLPSMPDLSHRLDDKQIQDALKAVSFLRLKEMKEPLPNTKRQVPIAPLDKSTGTENLSSTH